MARKEAPTITTKRPTLRSLSESDISSMSLLFGDKEVTKYLTGDTTAGAEHSMLKIVRTRRDIEWASMQR